MTGTNKIKRVTRIVAILIFSLFVFWDLVLGTLQIFISFVSFYICDKIFYFLLFIFFADK